MGHKHLELPKEHYDACFHPDNDSGKAMRLSWNRQPHRTVTWYPALMLADGPIFEIGCGAGHLALMCDDYGLEYRFGIDFSQQAVDLARERAGHRFKVLEAPSDKLAHMLQHGRYGTVVLLEILEHVYADIEILESIPSGKTVILSVPDFYTNGHVRWFASSKEVVGRYERALNVDRVIVERGVKSNNYWRILRGTKK